MLAAVYAGTGVATRHSVILQASDGDLAGLQSFYGETSPTTRDRMRVYEVEASALALVAAQRALADSRISQDRVTHLITVSCSGFYAPGFDIALINQLPLATGVARTQVGFMGCHGALNGLRVAQAFVAADPSAAYSSARSSFAAFIISTAGIPSRSWPTRCSPMGRALLLQCGEMVRR